MIWEEEVHHIFINLENKYKYTFSSSWEPHETLIWFYCYTKILSQSCDKTLDIPTCPKSQLLEWKPMLIINLS